MMTNTRILVSEFDYLEPRTVEEAIEGLVAYGDGAHVLAGGTDLLVHMKTGRADPLALVNICKIPDLLGLSENGGASLGAAVRIRQVELSESLYRRYTALVEAAAQVGSVQIRHMATVGGNLCNASPAADLPPALLALNAQVLIVGPSGERLIPLESFFLTRRDTALQLGELLARIDLPAPTPRSGSAFLKIGRVACDVAKVNAAVSLERDGDRIRSCRIALGSVAPVPIRSTRTETLLEGERYSAELAWQAGEEAAEEVKISRRSRLGRSTPEYRRAAVRSLVRDGIQIAWERAAQGRSAR